jgi:oxygen-independent coproporphyrinogen III oxidase
VSGIYIHIPYCYQACNYCDFHFSTNYKNKTELVNSILIELELRKDYLVDKQIETIYFGGGTPSILSEAELFVVLEKIYKLFSVDNLVELTIECNPDDLNENKLKEFKRLEINRLSVGLQSFNNDELKWMNRTHTAEQSEGSIKRAQDKGFENITVDLIYGSKFSNLKNWKTTLLKAIELEINHISSYNLTVEPKTKLGFDVSKKIESPIDDEKSAELFIEMIDVLTKNQFIHYEISNFAKEGFVSKHNSNYWKGKHYLGVGPSAHSFDGVSRQWNINNNNLYIKHLQQKSDAYFEKETLSQYDKFNETLLTGLRTMWGVNLKKLKAEYGQIITKNFDEKISKFSQQDLMYINEDENAVLTLNGKLMADKIASELFAV